MNIERVPVIGSMFKSIKAFCCFSFEFKVCLFHTPVFSVLIDFCYTNKKKISKKRPIKA